MSYSLLVLVSQATRETRTRDNCQGQKSRGVMGRQSRGVMAHSRILASVAAPFAASETDSTERLHRSSRRRPFDPVHFRGAVGGEAPSDGRAKAGSWIAQTALVRRTGATRPHVENAISKMGCVAEAAHRGERNVATFASPPKGASEFVATASLARRKCGHDAVLCCIII
jgi:hypothetical protein